MNRDFYSTLAKSDVAANAGTTRVKRSTRTEVLKPAATIATHTLELPAATRAFDDEVKVITTATITALTVTAAAGATLGAGFPTTLAAGGYFHAQLIDGVWRRV